MLGDLEYSSTPRRRGPLHRLSIREFQSVAEGLPAGNVAEFLCRKKSL
jgi:hypothetical protein